MGQDVLLDVGLTWRVSPEVIEGRASRTTAGRGLGEHPLVRSHCENCSGKHAAVILTAC